MNVRAHRWYLLLNCWENLAGGYWIKQLAFKLGVLELFLDFPRILDFGVFLRTGFQNKV
jgi:hypothetical protein